MPTPMPILLLKTLLKLGLWNVIYVAWYRFSLKSGIRKLWFPTSQLPTDQDYFKPTPKRTDYPEEWKSPLLEDADKIVSGNLRYYSCHWKEVGSPPKWFLNPFNGNTYPNPHLHWTKLPDFNTAVGDIKNIWEASRFEWVVTLARAYAITADEKYLLTLNSWLKDWALKNPLNTGPNWKCGQETSIRVFNLLNAAYILQQHSHPSEALVKFIEAHLERISPNIRYAIAQDNNHGTSEAAGLFIGGSWLAKANANATAKANTQKGRQWLQNRAKKLIADDGTFSQYAVNYHRVLLDTLSLVEFWRKQTDQPVFSAHFYTKARATINWLHQLTDDQSGNAPNLGSNDGASLLNMHSDPYRDFRPSIQLAGLLFFNQWRFTKNVSELVFWLNVQDSRTTPIKYNKHSVVFNAGFLTLITPTSWAMLRLPRFKFRPSHNDVFHFDLWYDGLNILSDAGTYSYNPPPEEEVVDLKSVQTHNTISFDGRDQMPKISRFLLGNWLQADSVGEIRTSADGWQSWEGQYTDNMKNMHKRKISTNGKTWQIEDTIAGHFKSATIGFNLNTLEARLEGNTCITPFAKISILAKANAIANANATLTKTIISEHYFQKRSIQRLNFTVTQPNTYVTTIHLL